jgi:uncharacterized RDD family membrane protein YckC
MSTEPSNEHNPYAPPQAAVAVGTQDLAVYDAASGGKRFANYVIDQITILALVFVLGLVLAILDEMGVTEGIADRLFGEASGVIGNLVGIGVGGVYYVVFEGLWGRTVGKLVTRTKAVAKKTGGRMSFGALIGRSLARFVPFEAFSFLGADSSGWHDQWSGTKVVDLKKPLVPVVPPPVGPRFFPGR